MQQPGRPALSVLYISNRILPNRSPIFWTIVAMLLKALSTIAKLKYGWICPISRSHFLWNESFARPMESLLKTWWEIVIYQLRWEQSRFALRSPCSPRSMHHSRNMQHPALSWRESTTYNSFKSKTEINKKTWNNEPILRFAEWCSFWQRWSRPPYS